MSEIPEQLLYAQTHEWVEEQDDGTIRIGITDHAQGELGDVVYVELPAVGTAVSAGAECAVVESVKAASDIYAPMSGEVVEINETLADSPEILNQSPYADGWMLRIQPDGGADMTDLLDAAGYADSIDED
jgi:glycine cleavage system H protein